MSKNFMNLVRLLTYANCGGEIVGEITVRYIFSFGFLKIEMVSSQKFDTRLANPPPLTLKIKITY